jgi:hypothetical protein
MPGLYNSNATGLQLTSDKSAKEQILGNQGRQNAEAPWSPQRTIKQRR